jgi:hypothetical protein
MKSSIIRNLFSIILINYTNSLYGIKLPDAIACTNNFKLNVTGTTVYFAHAIFYGAPMYCQVYALEERCIIFNANGSYRLGTGDLPSRLGC